MYVLTIFFMIVILKFLFNFIRLIATYFCYGKFKKQSKNLAQIIPFAEGLFNGAKTNMLIYQKSAKENTVSLISHFITNKSYYEDIDLTFNKTIGVYKFRILQCINPFYLIFLPKYIFEGLNITLSNISTSLIHFLYWIASFVTSYFLELYLDVHFGEFFQQIIDKFL